MGLHPVSENNLTALSLFAGGLPSPHGHPHKKRATYTARNPEATALHKIIRENINTFYSDLEGQNSRSELPYFVKNEFARYLKCGVLAHGFLRLKCADCKAERLLAFSCKGRGFCPSCGGRRQAETSSYLVDSVLPEVPIRQWVLSFPFPVRFLLATGGVHTNQVLRITQRVITSFLKKKAGLSNCKTASVTVIQRFGSSLNLNVHFHMLVPDGVFAEVAEDQAQLEMFSDFDQTKNCAFKVSRLLQTMTLKE